MVLSSQKDKFFEKNYAGCKANNIPCGVYWYSYAKTVEDAKKEAEACLEVIKNKQFELPIYFDIEENSQLAKGKDFCSALVTNFCNTIESAGYFAGFYISRDNLQNYIYALWVAEWGVNTPNCTGWGMWQYFDSGNVDGISGNVDLDYLDFDYETVIKQNGLNGFEKEDNSQNNNSIKVTIEFSGKTFVGELTEK